MNKQTNEQTNEWMDDIVTMEFNGKFMHWIPSGKKRLIPLQLLRIKALRIISNELKLFNSLWISTIIPKSN